MKTMKHFTGRILALMLVGILTIGSLSVPAFGAVVSQDVSTDVETSEEGETDSYEETEASDPDEETAPEDDITTIEDSVVEDTDVDTEISYTVTLDANGGYFENEWDDVLGEEVSTAEILNKKISAGDVVVTFPIYKKENQTAEFLGWSLERDGDLVTIGYENFTPIENCILFAAWDITKSTECNSSDGEGEAVTSSTAEDTSPIIKEDLENSDNAPEDTTSIDDIKEGGDVSLQEPPQESVSTEAVYEGTDIPQDAEYWCGHYYKAYPLSKTPIEAKAYCEAMGGYLATVHNYGELLFLDSIINSYSGYSEAIIGGTDEGHEGTWVWLNGEEWIYKRWGHRTDGLYYPDNKKGHNYLGLHTAGFAHDFYPGFFDINGNEQLNMFICEWGDRIDIASLSEDSFVLSKKNFAYSGLAQRPNVNINYNNNSNLPLYEGYDYTLSFSHNVNVGTASVQITGIGKYTGSICFNYYITPPVPDTPILKQEIDNRSISVSWGAVEQSEGYKIEYSTDKSFSSNVIIAEPEKVNDCMYITPALKRNTNYYFRICSIGVLDNDNCTSDWSKTSSLKSGNQLIASDFWGFGNPDLPTDLKYYTKIYGPEAGKYLFNRYEKNNRKGLCFGMTDLGLAILQDGHIDFSDISYEEKEIETLNDIKYMSLCKINNDSLANVLKYAQILQNDKSVAQEKEETKNNPQKINDMIALLRSGTAVHISLINNKQAHSLVGLYIHSEDSNQVEIAVYDPNKFTNESFSELLIITMKNGVPSKWSVKMEEDTWTGTIKKSIFNNTAISYCAHSPVELSKRYNDNFKQDIDQDQYWEIWLKDWETSREWLETKLKAKGLSYTEIAPNDKDDGSSTDEEGIAFWCNTIELSLDDIPSSSTIISSEKNKSVSIQMEKGSTIKLNTSNNSISVTPNDDSICTITYSNQNTQDSNATETTVVCNVKQGQEATIIEKSENDIRATGVTSLNYHSEIGRRNDNAVIESIDTHNVEKDELNPSVDYQITTNEETVILSKNPNDSNYSVIVAKESDSDNQAFLNAEVIGLKNYAYTGKPIVLNELAIKIAENVLIAGQDYSVMYSDNINAGTATVIITGKGNYSGTISKTFNIIKAAQNFSVKAAASSIDMGKTTRITVNGAKETTKYTFTSSNPKIATVNSTGTVTGKAAGIVTITVKTAETENYKSGSKTVKITVNKVLKKPGNCHFTKWNNSKYTSCRISWNKVDGAEGYQTLLSWTDGSHASQTVVKSNVLYRDCAVVANHVSQMKVRSFYTANGKRVYSLWSNVEYITPSPTKLTTKNASSGSNLKMNIGWNIIYGCNGYNVFITTNPNGKWYWNQSTSEKATATSASIVKCGGAKLKKDTRYYVRIVTRRKRNGVFCTVPMPANNTYIGSFVIK